jgi:hypothetical protein
MRMNLMGRIAMACGDVALLREALARLAQIEAVIPEATPLRLQPVIGLQGHMAWLEGRSDDAQALWQRALEHEEPCDLFGLAHELRTRLALQRLRQGAPADAAAWLLPMLRQATDGPRGALFALPALRELAARSHGASLHLDEAAQATPPGSRRWPSPAPSPRAPGASPAPVDRGLGDDGHHLQAAGGLAPSPRHSPRPGAPRCTDAVQRLRPTAAPRPARWPAAPTMP